MKLLKSNEDRPVQEIDFSRKSRFGEDGFTLVELMVVVTILGILFSIVSITVIQRIDETKWKTTVTQMNILENALESYRLDMGDYPTTEQGLQALVEAPAGAEGWYGPYLQKKVPTDNWNKPFIYRYPGEEHDGYEIISYGKDGVPGGEKWNKDIKSWE